MCAPQASRERLFGRLRYWLLLSSQGLPHLRLEPVYLPLDSHVTVAYTVPGRDETVLRDLYHVGDGQPLSVTPPRYWSPQLQLPAGPKRTDYGQIALPTVTVVCGTYSSDVTILLEQVYMCNLFVCFSSRIFE
jgi:hypothetical protein